MDKRRLLAQLEKRASRRLMFQLYAVPYDHSRPFGIDNVGVYEWQVRFHNLGSDHAERLLMAANRVGKSRTGAAEVAIHLTGLYPSWWQGRRFDEPVHWWCGSDTNETSRDIVQAALLGPIGRFGTGWVPGDLLHGNPTARQAGIGNVVDAFIVKHASGGFSHCGLKTYEQGVKTWQGTSKHGIWDDEEPPMDIYSEGLTRLLDKKGIMLVTRTPLGGPTEVVQHFMTGGPGIAVVNASWADAPHLDDTEKLRLAASYPEYERETRTKGAPLMGTGMVFPIPDDRIICDPFDLPKWFRRINGVDFGIDHPGAGAFCALDPTGPGTFYVYDCYRARDQTPIYHAAAMKKHGDWIPNAWPHDGLERDKGSGEIIKNQYRRHGLRMLKEHAHDPDPKISNHVEPALIEMYEWMRTGRFKVFRTCSQWFEEKRLYHRKQGMLVKEHDDIISAGRYAFMMRRYATTQPEAAQIGSPAPTQPIVGRARWARSDA